MFFYLFSMAKVVLFVGGMCIIFEAECKIGTKKVSNSSELDTLWGKIGENMRIMTLFGKEIRYTLFLSILLESFLCRCEKRCRVVLAMPDRIRKISLHCCIRDVLS